VFVFLAFLLAKN